MQEFIHDPEKLAKQRQDGAQDDKNASELLNMLPEAFVWKVESEDAEKFTLHFDPNPKFESAGYAGACAGHDDGRDGGGQGAAPDRDDQRAG